MDSPPARLTSEAHPSSPNPKVIYASARASVLVDPAMTKKHPMLIYQAMTVPTGMSLATNIIEMMLQ